MNYYFWFSLSLIFYLSKMFEKQIDFSILDINRQTYYYYVMIFGSYLKDSANDSFLKFSFKLFNSFYSFVQLQCNLWTKIPNMFAKDSLIWINSSCLYKICFTS